MLVGLNIVTVQGHKNALFSHRMTLGVPEGHLGKNKCLRINLLMYIVPFCTHHDRATAILGTRPPELPHGHPIERMLREAHFAFRKRGALKVIGNCFSCLPPVHRNAR
jgi:hypothetical protein